MNKLVYQVKNALNHYEEKISTAVMTGDIGTLAEFINNGAAEYSQQPILAKLCDKKRFDLAMLAMQKGVALDIGDKGYTALYYAAKYEHGELTRLLIEKGVRLTFTNDTKTNALMELADAEIGADQDELISLAELMLKKGLDINAVDKYNWTALHYAATRRHVELIRFLIRSGANVNIRSNYGKMFVPIQLAMGPKEYWENNYKAFLENGGLEGVKFQKSNDYDIENYLRAIEFDYPEMVKKYLELGADPNQRRFQKGGFGDYNTALMIAVYAHSPEIMELLIKFGADVTATNRNNKTALDIAESIRDQKAIDLLTRQGAVKQ